MAVGLPPSIFQQYPHPDRFLESELFAAFGWAAAQLGCSEIHWNSNSPDEYPCFAESTLFGDEDGAGSDFYTWGTWTESEELKEKAAKG